MVDAGDPTPDGTVTQPRLINGKFDRRYANADGVEIIPANLSGATVSVLTLPSLTSISGTTTANGTFSIPNVPEGPYYLKLGTRYIERSDNMVDVSFDVFGRPGVQGATNTTHVILDVTDLAPWQTNDEIQMVSLESGTVATDTEEFATGRPTVGATALVQFDYDLSNAISPALIDAVAGDQLTIAQLATTISGPHAFRTVARTLVDTPFQLANGGSANVAGAFTTVAATSTLDLVWDRPMFDAELTARAPREGLMNYTALTVVALPEAASRGYYDDGPTVVAHTPGYRSDKTTIAAAWSYGDPYPASWTRLMRARFETYRFVRLSGVDVPIFASMTSVRNLAGLTAATPIVPEIGAVVDPEINGVDAFGASLTGIGLTPTLSWTAPTIGTATRYTIIVTELSVVNGAPAFRDVARIDTPNTQTIVPPGVLATGKSYIFHFTSRATPLDLNAMPNGFVLPDDQANVISSIATP